MEHFRRVSKFNFSYLYQLLVYNFADPALQILEKRIQESRLEERKLLIAVWRCERFFLISFPFHLLLHFTEIVSRSFYYFPVLQRWTAKLGYVCAHVPDCTLFHSQQALQNRTPEQNRDREWTFYALFTLFLRSLWRLSWRSRHLLLTRMVLHLYHFSLDSVQLRLDNSNKFETIKIM